MRATPARARRGALALALAALAATLTLAALARAERPPVAGGQVPSTLSLALGDPSPFARSGPGLFTATLRAEVTASVAPVSLSLAEGEADTPLRSWREPVSRAPVKIHLRRSARAPRRDGGLVWVTLTAGGP